MVASVKQRWGLARSVGVVLVLCLVLIGCSGLQGADVIWEGNEERGVTGRLVSDGESIWWLDNPSEVDQGFNAFQADVRSGDIRWSREAGFFNSSNLVLHDGFLWLQVASLKKQNRLPEDDQLLKVDAGSGGLVGQVAVESDTQRGVVVDDVLWTVRWSNREVVLVDTETAEIVDSWELSDLQGVDFKPGNLTEGLVLLDGVVWIIDGENVAGFDAGSHELVELIELGDAVTVFDNDGFNQIEGHDGLLWAGNIEKSRNGAVEYAALRIDPETEEFETVDYFESPLGSVEYEGFVFDVVGPEKVDQINAETGETVASFENLNPFSFVVVDGYLWAHDNEKVFRYPVADG